MQVVFDFVYLAAAAIGVVGILEYLKGFWKTAPSIVWRLAMPLICIGVSILGDGGLWQVASNSVILVALCHLGYDKILAQGKEKV